MKSINWNAGKNQQLIKERGVSFEDVVFYLSQGELLDDLKHPNNDKYPDQRVFVLNIDSYVYLVPYVENRSEIFLKTIIPSRKATKQYLGDKS
ncbi:MAG: BrnT family toxin [Pseudomonadales bacterium]|nr:BrnT family toxin [Pseudomonadales bacterium]